VAVKIKLKRMGKIREPHYRIVVADARTKRDGRAIEEIGKYYPKSEPSFIEVNSDRAQHWLSVGAQPTDPVRKLLEITGDWQRFKGLPGAEGTLRTAAPRTDKKEVFAAALAETLTDNATTPKSKGRAGGVRAADAKAGDAKAGDGKSGDAKAGEGRGDKARADKPKSDKPAKAAKPDTAKAKQAKDEPAKDEPAKGEAAKDEATAPAAEADASADAAVKADEPAAGAGAAAETESGSGE